MAPPQGPKKSRQYQPRHKRASSPRQFNGRARIDAMYDAAWEAYRRRFLDANPRCYSCEEWATVVDHIVPHQGNEDLFRKLDNHLPLCARCHNIITAKFDRYHQRGVMPLQKLKWLKERRVAQGLTRRVRPLPSYEG